MALPIPLLLTEQTSCTIQWKPFLHAHATRLYLLGWVAISCELCHIRKAPLLPVNLPPLSMFLTWRKLAKKELLEPWIKWQSEIDRNAIMSRCWRDWEQHTLWRYRWEPEVRWSVTWLDLKQTGFRVHWGLLGRIKQTKTFQWISYWYYIHYVQVNSISSRCSHKHCVFTFHNLSTSTEQGW